MRRALITIAIAASLAACNNQGKKETQEPPQIRDTTKQICDFNIKPTEFNITDRELSTETVAAQKGKKVRNPPPPQPPKNLATPVVLLDFNGYTVIGTSWNFSGLTDTIVCSDAGLTVDEQQRMIDTAASYGRLGMFGIRVTTDEAVYAAADPKRRMRVVVTKNYEWFGQAGGVSFVNSFTWGDNTPCFVFSLLLNFNTKMIQEAIIHEVGHTLGLYHQCLYDANCVKISEYNSGYNDWAPIMGVGYYRNWVTWHDGPNPYGCTSMQKDSAVIRATLQIQ